MSGSVQKIDFKVPVIELHDRTGHRNAALLLDRHPVAGRMPGSLPGPDSTGLLDGATEKKKFFGQCGFAGIRMADNAKCTPPINFLLVMIAHDVVLWLIIGQVGFLIPYLLLVYLSYDWLRICSRPSPQRCDPPRRFFRDGHYQGRNEKARSFSFERKYIDYASLIRRRDGGGKTEEIVQ